VDKTRMRPPGCVCVCVCVCVCCHGRRRNAILVEGLGRNQYVSMVFNGHRREKTEAKKVTDEYHHALESPRFFLRVFPPYPRDATAQWTRRQIYRVRHNLFRVRAPPVT